MQYIPETHGSGAAPERQYMDAGHGVEGSLVPDGHCEPAGHAELRSTRRIRFEPLSPTKMNAPLECTATPCGDEKLALIANPLTTAERPLPATVMTS